MRIDAHQHFWNYEPVRDGWMEENMGVLKQDYLPAQLAPLLQRNGFDGCIAVQADQSETETRFLSAMADQHPFIKAVVGWVDLRDEEVEESLARLQHFPVIKGFRHILQGEQDRACMLKPGFRRGIAALQLYDYSYDILIYPDQLKYIRELLHDFPGQRFVIDHLAKPDIKSGKLDGWKEDMEAIGAHPNVYCKLSGMVTEHDWHGWQKDDFYPYMDVIVKAFGTDRIMFGSDWPVCLLAASYDEVVDIVRSYFSSFSKEEQAKVFGANAVKFYKLSI